jgi:hypothetical protein
VSFHIVYAVKGKEPEEGDVVASLSGWDMWAELVSKSEDAFPECAYLAEHGELYPEDAVDALESELEFVVKSPPKGFSAPTVGVFRSLLDAVLVRPGGTLGILITDGTPHDGDDSP